MATWLERSTVYISAAVPSSTRCARASFKCVCVPGLEEKKRCSKEITDQRNIFKRLLWHFIFVLIQVWAQCKRSCACYARFENLVNLRHLRKWQWLNLLLLGRWMADITVLSLCDISDNLSMFSCKDKRCTRFCRSVRSCWNCAKRSDNFNGAEEVCSTQPADLHNLPSCTACRSPVCAASLRNLAILVWSTPKKNWLPMFFLFKITVDFEENGRFWHKSLWNELRNILINFICKLSLEFQCFWKGLIYRKHLLTRKAPSAGTERIDHIEKCHSGLYSSIVFKSKTTYFL